MIKRINKLYILKKLKEERERITETQGRLLDEPEFKDSKDGLDYDYWNRLERSKEELHVCIRACEDLFKMTWEKNSHEYHEHLDRLEKEFSANG